MIEEITDIISDADSELSAIVAFGKKIAAKKRYNQYDSNGDSRKAANTLVWFLEKIERGEHKKGSIKND